MTNQEILTKAIEKAIAGGWKAEITEYGWLRILAPSGYLTSAYSKGTWGSPSIIFNHDFAKSLWGKDQLLYSAVIPNYVGSLEKIELYPWQYHLQQMVIADDPIKYLGENL